jgi:hypothetical protein
MALSVNSVMQGDQQQSLYLVCVAEMHCVHGTVHTVGDPVSDCILQQWTNVRENVHGFFW